MHLCPQELRDRSCAAFSKLSLCMAENTSTQISSAVIDSFAKGELDVSSCVSPLFSSCFVSRVRVP